MNKEKKNIFLIGFMGAGKSTIARAIKQKLGYPVVEMDERIVKEQGMPISKIFETYGELYFRELERDGLIKVLDEYVFRKVCMQQLEWQKQGKEIIPVSINLSRASLYFDSVVSRYQQIADEIGVKTHLVPIEITESAAIDNDNIKGLADKFHDNGFPLLVDDFGSGYSSLATLNMKCFDTLKIDKSLIDYIGDFSGERLLEHTILLAKELGLCVTAEGVEREEQVDFLKQMKCDSIQGYYYSRPLPKEEFEKLLLTA